MYISSMPTNQITAHQRKSQSFQPCAFSLCILIHTYYILFVDAPIILERAFTRLSIYLGIIKARRLVFDNPGWNRTRQIMNPRSRLSSAGKMRVSRATEYKYICTQRN